MSKSFYITLLTLVVIAVGAAVAIFLAKGYTFSPEQGRILGTGIMSVTSVPEGAAVYIDDHLTTATNNTVTSLPAKKYKVKIQKEGFISWEKEVEVQEGLVTNVKATLFPAIPTIFPLTFNGVLNLSLSPDGQNLVFTVPFIGDPHVKEKGGVWVWTMTSAPISFARAAEPHQLVASTPGLDFSKSKVRWSPDSKQLLITLEPGEGTTLQRNYLLPINQLTANDNLRDITPTLASTLQSWQAEQIEKDHARILSIEDSNLRNIASSSAVIKWSPDETKFMVAGKKEQTTVTPTRGAVKSPTSTPNLDKFKVYSLEIERERQIYKEYDLPEAKSYMWLPNSEHIILVSDDKISVSEYDGSNLAVLYAGSFDISTVFPWPDSSRLVFVSSFPTPTANKPNLFGINLK